MRHAASVSDDIKSFVRAFQILVNLHFHVIEFYFYAVKEGIIICRARGDLVQSLDHFNDAVQDPFGQYQAQISGSGFKRRTDQAFFNTADSASPASHQISESLYDNAAAQHIGQPGNAFSIAVAVPERLGKVLGDQQGEIGVFCPHIHIFITVAVGGDDPVGIFVHYNAVGIHTESPDIILKFLCPVYDLAFVQLIGEMGKDHCGKLHPDSQVYPVGQGRNGELAADRFHPFASAAADRDDTFSAVGRGIPVYYPETFRKNFYR